MACGLLGHCTGKAASPEQPHCEFNRGQGVEHRVMKLKKKPLETDAQPGAWNGVYFFTHSLII